MTAPCVGKWELFDSTDLTDHITAATLCGDCPLLLQCRTRATTKALRSEHGNGVAGTWAGILYISGRRADARWEGHCSVCGSGPGRGCVSERGSRLNHPHNARNPVPMPCANCGNDFLPSREHWRHCSDDCAAAARRKSYQTYGAKRASRMGERRGA